MNNYGFEIDFINVGSGERSGDAIAVRYGTPGNYIVMVVDGGNKESGQALVDHIQTNYKTSFVHYLVNTHPDMDHASGLEVVLEKLSVGEVWLHQPWKYKEQILTLMKDQRITANSLEERMKNALNHAYKIEEIAKKKIKPIPVHEPFAGSRIGSFYVASPSRSWYLEIISHFNKTPDAKFNPRNIGILGLGGLSGLGLLNSNYKSGLGIADLINPANTNPLLRAVAENIVNYEWWGKETLKDGRVTSYDNESSVILYANLADQGILLTADAGCQALTHAANFLELCGVTLPNNLKFIQIPHHGSRNNIGPTILNRLVGHPRNENSNSGITAFVTAGAQSKTHPRKVVTNAFKRRGVNVINIKGVSACYPYNMPLRPNWISASQVPFYDCVENY